ncbi:hypothetical protein C8R46DRAFT_650312 [Mycena filopes]|nr:hypothetical protein C8R46DRAFT_650312 [Mycena filopes]
MNRGTRNAFCLYSVSSCPQHSHPPLDLRSTSENYLACRLLPTACLCTDRPSCSHMVLSALSMLAARHEYLGYMVSWFAWSRKKSAGRVRCLRSSEFQFSWNRDMPSFTAGCFIPHGSTREAIWVSAQPLRIARRGCDIPVLRPGRLATGRTSAVSKTKESSWTR